MVTVPSAVPRCARPGAGVVLVAFGKPEGNGASVWRRPGNTRGFETGAAAVAGSDKLVVFVPVGDAVAAGESSLMVMAPNMLKPGAFVVSARRPDEVSGWPGTGERAGLAHHRVEAELVPVGGMVAVVLRNEGARLAEVQRADVRCGSAVY
jgi:hypothetical protein